MLGKTEADLDSLTGGSQKIIQLDTSLVAAFVTGQISWDTIRKVPLFDTGFADVRISAGLEMYVPFYNDTGADIANGTVVIAQGADVTNEVVKGVPADASTPLLSSPVIGVATHLVANGTIGLATCFGEIHDINTAAMSVGTPLYLSDTVVGGLSTTRPKHPNAVVIVGTVIKSDATTGVILTNISRVTRSPIVKDYNITTGSIGKHYVGGFYQWATASVTLNQGSLTQTYGTANISREAHAGIVPQAAGTVDTGQVGLRVTGIMDSETGPQLAAQTAIITDDITTLTANVMAETVEKFSGQVTYELYVVSGTPTAYSLTFNYGFSKYEDFANINFTLSGFEAVWEGGATSTGMDIVVRKHTPTGWTYAASGFVPGNGYICKRSIDQALAPNISSGVQGAYKRVDLDAYIEGQVDEGILIEVVTTTINSIANMDIHALVYSEEIV